MRLVDRHPIDALTLPRGDDDDLAAVAWAERTIRRALAQLEPRELHLVTIDGWFSQRWLGFSHKELGAVRFATMDLRVPPFVPSRVLTHACLIREAGGVPARRRRPHRLVRRAGTQGRRRVAGGADGRHRRARAHGGRGGRRDRELTVAADSARRSMRGCRRRHWRGVVSTAITRR
jgi:hypothetical protein